MIQCQRGVPVPSQQTHEMIEMYLHLKIISIETTIILLGLLLFRWNIELDFVASFHFNAYTIYRI